MSEPKRTEVLDSLFTQDQGIGISIFRGEIFPQFNTTPAAFDFSKRYDQAWTMQQAKARGVDKIIATTWTSSKWMKTNNTHEHGGYLKQENYGDFVELLAKFIKEYKAQYDINLYAISMSNEPNSMTFLEWNSCEWNGVAFYVSPDNENWIKIDHVSTQGSYTRNGWYQKEYKALKYIPEGMNYFKVEFSGTGSWNKQLSQITISQKLEIH